MSIVRGVAKLIALLGGAVITVVSLMALAGMYTDNGWARAGIAIAVTLAVPLFVVERILARLSPDKVKGVTTDALAVIYLGFALAFVGVAHDFARPRLIAESHRLDAAGVASLAWLTEFLAGGRGASGTAIAAPAPVAAPTPAPAAPTTPSPPTPPPQKPGRASFVRATDSRAHRRRSSASSPLASYAASYERLRALAPEVMFVIGWSRGREALFGRDLAALAKLPATGNVRLAGTAGRPETLFALVMLELAGVPPSRVELGDPPAALSAALRTARKPPSGKLLVSSADTPRLMPVVAIVPHGFAAAHAAELESWTRAWLGGVAQLHRDPPAAGRLVATLPGAPPVLGVIEALGQVEFASLRENAAAFGLSGRGALTLDEICRTTWRIWRDTGVITTPVPEAAPLFADIVAGLVRGDPAAVAHQPPPRELAGDAARRPDVLLVARTPPTPSGKLDADAFVTRIGLLAGIFDRLQLRVAVKDGPKAAELLTDLARDRFGLRPNQLVPARKPAAGAAATIEVLAPR